jgi:Rieske Fe-S protein
MMNLDRSRRRWVKRFMLGTVASVSLPRWTGVLLAEMSSSLPSAAVITLKLADYPNLVGVGGSLQLRFSDFVEPLTLNRVSPQEFVTLDSVCTHQGCTVGPFILADNCMTCPCHGSRFDVEGKVFRDGLGSTEPAPSDLNRYETSYDAAAEAVAITIPGLALGVKSIEVFPQPLTGVVKVKLTFPATRGSTYEVSHQAGLDGTFVVAPFTITPTGTQLLTSITPTTDGEVTAYIDATGARGFYVVGLQLSAV